MPWRLEQQDGQWCVVREADGETEGCHATRREALTQIAALYATEADSEDGDAAITRDLILVPEGVRSGDGRLILESTWRDPPLPLGAQLEDNIGHDGARIVGSITTVWRDDQDRIWGRARFDVNSQDEQTRTQATRALEAVDDRVIYPSIDLTYTDETLLEEEMQDTPGREGFILLTVTRGRIAGASLTRIPAFEGTGLPRTATAAPVAASAAPVRAPVQGAPAAFYANPNLPELTPLRFVREGDLVRVYGHITDRNACHTGQSAFCQPPPAVGDARYFRTGIVTADDGQEIPVGQLTFSGPHASLYASVHQIADHHADISLAVADAAAGDDPFGSWIAGVIREDVTEDELNAMRAASWSGHWVPIHGRNELAAVHTVNNPGYPIPRIRAAGLAASGALTGLIVACPTGPCAPDLEERLRVLERDRHLRRLRIAG